MSDIRQSTEPWKTHKLKTTMSTKKSTIRLRFVNMEYKTIIYISVTINIAYACKWLKTVINSYNCYQIITVIV